jgi:hypothetical protein
MRPASLSSFDATRATACALLVSYSVASCSSATLTRSQYAATSCEVDCSLLAYTKHSTDAYTSPVATCERITQAIKHTHAHKARCPKCGVPGGRCRRT